MAHAMHIISPCVRPKRAQKQNIRIFPTYFAYQDGQKRANRTKITYRKPLQPFAADNFRRQWLSYVEAYFGAGDDDA